MTAPLPENWPEGWTTPEWQPGAKQWISRGPEIAGYHDVGFCEVSGGGGGCSFDAPDVVQSYMEKLGHELPDGPRITTTQEQSNV